jgi:hypothetical protein
MIDLHCHSYFSDGLLSPEALLQKALAAQIKFLALTDHDSVDGIERLHAAAYGHPITVIDGIELSVQWKKYDIHILGLGVKPDALHLKQIIQDQQARRIKRAQGIGELLRACGVENAYRKACDLAGHERVGRLHFATVLINEAKVSDIKSAFKYYLGAGKPAYVPSSWLGLDQAVDSIRQAGGQAVIAHPLKYKLTRTKLHELIKAFKMLHGAGMEVVSGDTTHKDACAVAELCKRFGLQASSGSDYHGDGLSRIALGSQIQLPDQCTPIWHTWSGV